MSDNLSFSLRTYVVKEENRNQLPQIFLWPPEEFHDTHVCVCVQPPLHTK